MAGNSLFQKIKSLITNREIISYLIVGVLTTIVSLAVYYGCVATFLDPNDAVQLQAANVFSWIASVTFAYFTNRKFVFQSKNTHVVKEAVSFYASRLVTLGIDMGLMFLFVSTLSMNDKVAKIIVQIIIIISNYLISKFIVFKKDKNTPA